MKPKFPICGSCCVALLQPESAGLEWGRHSPAHTPVGRVTPVPSGFMACTAGRHQGAIETFCSAVRLSMFSTVIGV